jgi:2-iminobutanoate/2-iminopropanoate deaminase
VEQAGAGLAKGLVCDLANGWRTTPSRAGPFHWRSRGPGPGRLIDGDAGRQTEQILSNLAVALAAAGKDLGDVVRVGVYLTDMTDFAAMNEVYGRHFAEPYPARTTIGVTALPLGAAVEMDVVVA